ncbi:LLM class flavin-dependent oxidoreductase [Aeromicrobium stalagmiti]|uniref:LLM class flavin-dependent oxidoreductase n=1 Tax=Aeromicrobium stalagmiti TaxID=2738988 RepID=UPI001569111E|nr:LLM class flavin-dependent oxidoreductase [Aeromicrobium stalagmiti]NRQ51673.1 LLM class flavin-dependent oxidoreductase [Aeromicrobium stalagmiti]
MDSDAPRSSAPLELGLDTFGDVTAGEDGTPLPYDQVIRNVIDQAVLADELGLAFFGVGEHHREDFAVTAPEVVLAAIASRTTRIHLGTAVTVLSSDDPIRVYERFATLDAVSGGRAEVILGRGSFTESFPLFGFDLAQYEELFAEKLDLFAALRSEGPITWEGNLRPPLVEQDIFPKTAAGSVTTWIGVGGSPESVIRAARYGIPLMLAIIGGPPAQFAPYADLYRQALDQLGQPVLPIGVHSPGHVADTDEQAREELWPHFAVQRERIGRERGWPPPTREEFEASAGPEGAIYVGSPQTVADKIVRNTRILGLDRFDLKFSNGALPHDKLMRSIELYGREVAPLVHAALA